MGKKQFKTRAIIMNKSLDDVANVLEDTLNAFAEAGYSPQFSAVEHAGVLLGYLVIGKLDDDETAKEFLKEKLEELRKHLVEAKQATATEGNDAPLTPIEHRAVAIVDAVLSTGVTPGDLPKELPAILHGIVGSPPASTLAELAEGCESTAKRHNLWHPDPTCPVPKISLLVAAKLREMSRENLS